MSLSLLVRKSVAIGSLAAILPGLLFAQAAPLPFGVESGLTPGTRGDQTRPRIAVNALGGFAVWEESAADGDGFGIRAMALDSDLRPAQAPFRINSFGRGDQENPQVALLAKGGAAFVWQSGRMGFQKIVGRFLLADNSWATSDLAISSYARAGQRDPAIAALSNGNLVVVWTSFNQRGATSMQDVYGQILAPDGTKMGGEFAVNEFASFNQRTPAVAALPGGGFVVVWVSEQQRVALAPLSDPIQSGPKTLPSIDIYARTFDANGSSLGAEFLVNTDQTICANPSVASNPDGTCLVAWGQVDLIKPVNRWDVFGRTLASGQPQGNARRINTRVYGDQFAPQVAAVSGDWLVVWTSMAQDGSQEGVFGQMLNTVGAAAGTELRVNTTILNAQKQPAVASDNSRAMVVWTSYVGGAASFDLMAQTYAAPGYVVAAASTNYAVPAFIEDPTVPGGAVDPSTGLAVLDFPNSPNPGSQPDSGFAVAAGTYRGLFYDNNGVAAASAGYLTAKVTKRGTFSARLNLAGASYTASGKFDAQGTAAASLGGSATRIDLNLKVDLSGGNQLHGSVTRGSLWSADILADRAPTMKPNPFAGTYTVLIPPGDNSRSTPAGYGFGSVKVDPSGTVVLMGTLSDGTKLAQSSAVSAQGVWPLYSAPYGGRGVVVSWVQFTNNRMGGAMVWARPASTGPMYAAGFTNLVNVSGSVYQTTPAQSRAVSLQNGSGDLIFAEGGLSTPFTNQVQLQSNTRLTTLFGSPLSSFRIAPASGLFRGVIRNPETGKPLQFQGSVLQDENFGAGFFLGPDASGQVFLLSPTP